MVLSFSSSNPCSTGDSAGRSSDKDLATSFESFKAERILAAASSSKWSILDGSSSSDSGIYSSEDIPSGISSMSVAAESLDALSSVIVDSRDDPE